MKKLVGVLVLLVVGAAVGAQWPQRAQAQSSHPYWSVEWSRFLQYMSLEMVDDGTGNQVPTVQFTGANVRIVNGLGSTQTKNSTGNLIVGYNEFGNPDGDDRTGSHNFAFGEANSFSSFGGLVGPNENTISGAFATVSGGRGCMADGEYSSVSGGIYNTASGRFASVSGGTGNNAVGKYSSVGAGRSNTAYGLFSSVSGGIFNEARGSYAAVSGGWGNNAYGRAASVSGGIFNEARGSYAAVSGGWENHAVGRAASVSAGTYNVATGTYSSVSGGAFRYAYGNSDWVAGSLFEDY